MSQNCLRRCSVPPNHPSEPDRFISYLLTADASDYLLSRNCPEAREVPCSKGSFLPFSANIKEQSMQRYKVRFSCPKSGIILKIHQNFLMGSSWGFCCNCILAPACSFCPLPLLLPLPPGANLSAHLTKLHAHTTLNVSC